MLAQLKACYLVMSNFSALCVWLNACFSCCLCAWFTSRRASLTRRESNVKCVRLKERWGNERWEMSIVSESCMRGVEQLQRPWFSSCWRTPLHREREVIQLPRAGLWLPPDSETPHSLSHIHACIPIQHHMHTCFIYSWAVICFVPYFLYTLVFLFLFTSTTASRYHRLKWHNPASHFMCPWCTQTNYSRLSPFSESNLAPSSLALYTVIYHTAPPRAHLSFSEMTQDEVTAFALAPASLFLALQGCAKGYVLTAERSAQSSVRGTRPWKLKYPLCSTTNKCKGQPNSKMWRETFFSSFICRAYCIAQYYSLLASSI